MSLIGHADEVATLREAVLSGRLHHAWLLAGPEGVGKATFARAAALWMLATAAGPAPTGDDFAVEDGHRIAHLFHAGSHPDFRMLRRLPKDKSEELARSIPIDQVRALQPLFATSPSLSLRRVVLIDAVDDLERAGANALLKNLEEPPAGTIFILVSHSPGRLLPTIRSRCRLLRFSGLDEADSARVLRIALPEQDAGEIATLATIAAGAPGQAIRFAGLDVAGLDRAIDRIAREGDATGLQRLTLAKQLSGKAAQARYEAFLERAPGRIAQAAREGGADLDRKVALWTQARGIADGAVRLSMDSQTTVFEMAGLLAKLAG
ncbi:AAA family ATPase [Sphingomonas sp. BIUV-7]|uniref:AAA family ATPase n=1 Tax=Sphingomonas natans TaxID=3063330 RepID=A0ABT8Y444_9SPHN|nr:AAA family ATPase [Sphingomonas sp. BIUV-7]MDO6413093.1 AAA family ATPase [Sphingomonas sp. BIUV-7]